MGVGVKMPRVPAVYPRKRRWRLPEQENPEAHRAYWGQGADNDNYASAKEFLETVEEQLEQSVSKGQAVKLTEAEARRKYGRRSGGSISGGSVEKWYQRVGRPRGETPV